MRWYADRLDEGWESVKDDPDDATSTHAPSDYVLGGNCFFSCEPDEPHLPALVEGLGADRVVFASDYPHFDCKFPDSVDAIVNAGLHESAIDAVTKTSATRLYRL